MFLYYKTNNANIIIEIHPEAKNLLDYILIWGMKGRQQSYQEYYTNENNQKALSFIENSSSEIRTLLKSKPSKMQSSDIDFKGIL
jgi:hypothetical protein